MLDGEIVFADVMVARWWVLVLRGVAALIFGALTLRAPGITLLVLALWFAAYLAVDGVLSLMAGVKAVAHHRHGAALIAHGVVGLLAAALVMAWPGAGIFGFVILVAVWAMVSGAALLAGASLLPFPGGQFLLAASALLSILFGVVMVARPAAGAVVLALWLGAYALVSGVLLVAAGLRMRARGVAA